MPELSANLYKTQFSPIRNFNGLIEEAKKKGAEVYELDDLVSELHLGNPDVPNSLDEHREHLIRQINEPEAQKQIIELMRSGLYGNIPYGKSTGEPELRELIAEPYKKYGITKDNVFVTVGSTQAIDFLLRATLDKEKGTFIIPEPFYTNDLQLGTFSGFNVLPIERNFDNGFRLPDKKTIEELIQSHNYLPYYKRVNTLIITNPDNPTGVVYSPKELEMFREVAKKFDLWVIVDSAYNNIKHIKDYANPFEVFDKDRLIEVMSFSKTYNIPGARMGAIITPNKELCKHIEKESRKQGDGHMEKPFQSYLCPPIPSQILAIEAIKRTSQQDLKKASETYLRRVEAACDELDKLHDLDLRYVKPQGAFYMMSKINGVDTEKLLIHMLLEEFYGKMKKTASFAPGKGFHVQNIKGLIKGYDELRLALVVPEEKIRKGIQIIGRGIESYKDKEWEYQKKGVELLMGASLERY